MSNPTNKNLFERADNSKSNQPNNFGSGWKPANPDGTVPGRMKKGQLHSQPDNT